MTDEPTNKQRFNELKCEIMLFADSLHAQGKRELCNAMAEVYLSIKKHALKFGQDEQATKPVKEGFI